MSIADIYGVGCCRPSIKVTDTGSMSTYEKLCYVLEKAQEVIEIVNEFGDELDAKEDSSNITGARKLSENGNFTGSWNGDTHLEVTQQIDSNADQLEYLTEQFETGQTGRVIDEGIWDAGGSIINTFDGGVW